MYKLVGREQLSGKTSMMNLVEGGSLPSAVPACTQMKQCDEREAVDSRRKEKEQAKQEKTVVWRRGTRKENRN